MKIKLLMVSSLDGRSTKWDEENTDWASNEDQEIFRRTLNESSVIIMGRKTYESVKVRTSLATDQLRIVLTKHPEVYEKDSVSAKLEFSSSAPDALLESLEGRGFDEAILVGGEELNSAFLASGLIDEIWLTIEPQIFGEGKGLFGSKRFSIGCQLTSVSKLNDKGTLLLKYRVI